ncbi:phage tail family protein [Halalkalibacter oceani]|uniref:phage tail family protein n=1 Tax=Halalkalibacter oceani TaxID=1653776 RepID=UPI003397310E
MHLSVWRWGDKVKKLTLKGHLGSVELGNTGPFILVELDGESATPNEVQLQKAPYQAGATKVGMVYEPRYLTIEGAIVSQNKQEIARLRRELQRALVADYDIELTYDHHGGTNQIVASVESAPYFPPKREGVFQHFMVNLVCPEPFWLDPYVSGEQMAYLMGGLKFPLVLPTQFAHRGYQRVFENVGDVPTPVEIEFKGPAINPTVSNLTTGEYMAVGRELGEHDILYVDTTFGKKRVEIRRADGTVENAMHYITDLNVAFFQLELGENLLEYSSNNDSTLTRVRVSYRNRYCGI